MNLGTLLLLVVVTITVTGCGGARILALLPYNGRSHFIVMEPLLLALQARGHHLTVLSSFPQKKPLQNYTDIVLNTKLPRTLNAYSLRDITLNMKSPFNNAFHMTEVHTELCDRLMREERVLALLKERFDLVIGEIFGSDCFNYFAYKLKVPLVSWVTSMAVPWAADRVGLPDNPAYIPNYFLDYTTDMNFFQRVFSTITLVYSKIVYYYYSEIPAHRLAESLFNETLPPMEEVNRMTSLLLLNSHLSLTQSRPLPPNVIEVGGTHIRETQPLPKDLQDLVDGAKNGVILFSLGSLVRLSSVPKHILNNFLAAFAKLPQLVIMKYEMPLPGAPPNVIARNWTPQADIIAHPNVRAVITHCGLASTIEAVHFAKPIVAVPIFADQFFNAKNVVRRGGGVMLDIEQATQEDIFQAIKAVVENPRYTEQMKQLSLRFRDRPMGALQSAVYWTEYVIRHKGADHLRPASVGMPLYQYLLLDVIALLLAVLAAFVAGLYMFLKIISALICDRKRTESLNSVSNHVGNKKLN